MRTRTPLLLTSGLLLSCGSSSGVAGESTGIETATSSAFEVASSSTGAPMPDTSPLTSTAAPGTETTTTGSVDEEDDNGPEPPITFDFGVTPDFGEFDDGCNAVDFLFVIDNSGSMFDAQTNLVANFPAFINGIQATLVDVESYHVGITTSDAYAGNPLECRTLGSLVTSTAGFNSSASACGPYTEGFSYITEADDLTTSFACAAQVGTSGAGLEIPMNALEAAIGVDLNASGACNEGFVRDNALLVVIVITDEADGPGDAEGAPPASSTGDPASWYQSVLDAKDDTPENAAALVLTNYDDGPCPPGSIFEDGGNLVEFASLFGENGFVAGICEPDYGPSFAQATAVIQQACENFIPPG